ncbi:hypothetical protein CONPUDRAFT_71457 [Coniophora puteana RWD-64-598 SS2]|uniref:F-box domain-containing protein n=1 Tax=Coniophora puteana (strain RWD-64-598) TaxID=741705 RepID=A0A5M3MU85_CONPW|nr:uncharacterized protein CONPUDRAFT_71457 [Coniophora puteana RWD-64-598 SS2]EIW82732.1 hypothetical protein CONPUDRAFT_71457 [Coniophora puteana RWD-64-598 SS2]
MVTTLETITFDVLIQIIAQLDITDVLRLRQVSTRLLEVTLERALWDELYRSSHLPRTIGPLPSQSQQDLESVLARSAQVGHNMFVKGSPVRSRVVEYGPDCWGARILAGKVLLYVDPGSSTRKESVLFYNLDDDMLGDPQVVHEFDGEHASVISIDSVDVHDFRGQGHAYVGLQTANSESRDTEVLIMKMKDSGDELKFELVYRYTRDANSFHSLVASPRHIIVGHMLKNKSMAHVFDISGLEGGPLAEVEDTDETLVISDGDIGFGPDFYACSTHLIFLKPHPDPRETCMRLTAVPLMDSSAGSDSECRPEAPTCDIDAFEPLSFGILRDSIVDREPGYTEVIVHGLAERNGVYTLTVSKLLIPSHIGPDASQEIRVTSHIVVNFPDRPGLYMQPSFTGSARCIFYYSNEAATAELRALEYCYDEATERPVLLDSTSNLDYLGVLYDDFVTRDAEMQHFEQEPHSGRILYHYRTSPSEDDPSREESNLCIVDFA